jgi:hypothetical protein
MKDMDTGFMLRAGAVAAVAALFFIVLMFVLFSVFHFVSPVEYLTKELNTYVEYENFFKALETTGSITYAIDTISIIAWIIVWIGLSLLVRSRGHTLANVVLVLGLLAALADFVQNLEILAVIELRSSDYKELIKAIWRITYQTAHFLTFTAAVVTALGLWNKKPLNLAMAFTGTIFSAAAIFDLYMGLSGFILLGWNLAFLCCAALLMWRGAAEAK